jgi:thiamine biosynthesis protein ThiC
MDTTTRSLAVIRDEIVRDWHNPYFGAVPYLQAMGRLDKITDQLGWDDGTDIVIRFLSNARTWRGDTARRVKAELKAMLKN